MSLKDFFVPKTIDNSPVNWPRFASKTLVETGVSYIAFYGSIALVCVAYNEYKIRRDRSLGITTTEE